MKKVSKRLVAVLLSALMVITSLPLVAVAGVDSLDAVDENTVEINAAINAYVSAMDGTVYQNMQAAYDAYQDALQALDSYNYGGVSATDAKLDTYASALTTATNNMKKWTQPTFDGTAYWNDNNGNISTATNAYSGVVYGSQTTNFGTQSTYQNIKMKVDLPAVMVYAYDGSTDVYGPVVFENLASSSRSNVIHYVYSSDSTFYLDQNWQGYAASYSKWIGDNIQTSAEFCYYNAGDDNPQEASGQTNTSTTRYWWNKLKYHGTGNTTDYYETFSNISFGCKTSSKLGSRSYSSGTLSTSFTNYVINYQPIAKYESEAAKILSDAISGGKITDYQQGGLEALLKNLDYLTVDAVNPNTYTYTDSTAADQVKACAAAIKSAASSYNTATVTADGSGYTTLKSAIQNSVERYNGGVNSGYTAETWSNFADAYTNAVSVFTNIQTTGYSDNSNAASLATYLNLYRNQLKTEVEKVDTKDLEAAIDNGLKAVDYQDYFTEETYSLNNLESVIATAQSTVWGSVDNYKKDGYKLDDDEDGTNAAIVAEQLALVKAAVTSLKINCDATVDTASGYSLNTALDAANAINGSDWANYADLQNQIAIANSYKNGFTVIDVTQKYGQGTVNVVEAYQQQIKDLLAAINSLKPSFAKMVNGTRASEGETATTRITSSANSGNWILDSSRSNNIIFFRTTHDASTFDLGTMSFTFTSQQDYDNILDSININDTNETVGELTSKSNSDTSYGLDATATSTYTGGLSVTSNGKFYIENIKVTDHGSASNYGKDADGNAIDSADYIYDSLLATTEGTAPATGGIMAKKGNATKFQADYKLYVNKVTAKTVSASTLPTKTTYLLSESDTYLGMVYHWKYYGSLAYTYQGYSHDRAAYGESIDVVDISYLLDLIDTIDSDVNPLEFTTSSWSDLQDAITAAKAEMAYSTMTADEILTECKTRYTNLWNALQDLKYAASNENIKTALEDTTATYLAGNTGYSESSWATFKAAYEQAKSDYEGKYSDLNVRDYGRTADQATVDAVATALTDAYNALEAFADFSPVDDAAKALAESLEDDTYTASSLKAIATALTDATQYPYLNKTADERKTVFTNEKDNIAAEAEQIKALTATTATIDSSTLDAAATNVKSQYSDPDAWAGIDDAIQKIKDLNIYETVTVYGYDVEGVKYDDQTALDAEVTNLLTGVAPQTYTVTVDGEQVGTYEYGDTVTVKSPTGANVDWYYSYTSNTSSNAAKYYTTCSELEFVVKGNTEFTTSSAKADQDLVKVTYVSGLNNKIIATDYVAAGDSVTLPTAPALPYYQFTNYTVKGSVITSLAPTANVTVVANYEKTDDDDMFTITVWNETAGDFDEREITAYYNEKIELESDEAYMWTQVTGDGIDAWNDGENSEVVVHYGPTYTFYAHEDAYIIIYHSEEEVADIGQLDDTKYDTNGASADIDKNIHITDNKFSMIGMFALPEGCEYVECGMLFSTDTSADLQLGSASDTGSIRRLKSSQHTDGDQFVISIKTANITSNISFAYCAYFTYKDSKGTQHTVYSDTEVKNNVKVTL